MHRKLSRALVALIAGVGTLPHSAWAQTATAETPELADLVIVENETVMRFVSCDQDQPLISGRVVIKNIGRDTARRGVGGALITIVRIYLPLSIDFTEDRSDQKLLEPFEAASIAFDLGAGREKRGRLVPSGSYPPIRGVTAEGFVRGFVRGGRRGGGFENGFGYGDDLYRRGRVKKRRGGERCDGDCAGYLNGGSGYLNGGAGYLNGGSGNGGVDIYALSDYQVREIQRALARLGIYHLSVDGIYGRGTRRAVRHFALSIGKRTPGRFLSRSLLRRLQQTSGVEISALYGVGYGSGRIGDAPIILNGRSGRRGDIIRSGRDLRPGRVGTRTEYSRSIRTPTSGQFEIDVFVQVDPIDRVEEIIETNNLSAFRISVRECAAPNRVNPNENGGGGATRE